MAFELKLYFALVLATALQRVLELFISTRNEKALKSQGAIEIGHSHFIYMKALHAVWPIACLVEAYFRGAPPSYAVMIFFGSIFFVGQALRIMAISTLGKRWTVKILVLPGVPPVTKGIFRYLRHPNYLGVVLEIFSLPLIYGGWVSALIFSLLNAWLLRVRISREEKALDEANRYSTYFRDHNRFLPSKGHPHVRQ